MENREFMSVFFHTLKTQGIFYKKNIKNMFLHGEFASNTVNILNFKFLCLASLSIMIQLRILPQINGLKSKIG